MPKGKKAEPAAPSPEQGNGDGKVNKMEAVRQVIAKHGKDTMPTEIVQYVKAEHGADITVGTASTYKGTILKKLAEEGASQPEKKAAAAPKQKAPTAAPAPANGTKVNKMEAVRQVILKHGKDTMPVDIVKLLKAEHGVDMNTDTASTYKSTALKKLGLGGVRKGKQGRKPGPKPAAAPTANGEAKAAPKASGGSIALEDIQAVKTLVARMGADKVRQLAQVLA